MFRRPAFRENAARYRLVFAHDPSLWDPLPDDSQKHPKAFRSFSDDVLSRSLPRAGSLLFEVSRRHFHETMSDFPPKIIFRCRPKLTRP